MEMEEVYNSTYLEDLLREYQDSFFTYQQPEKVALICIYIPVFIVALFGNILVLVMVWLNKRIRRNIVNYFLVNLAVADLLVTLVCIPLTVGRYIYTPWLYGEFLCRAMGFLQGIAVEGSVLTIVCMSAERYLAIRHPLKVKVWCSQRCVKIAILFTWITAIITMCPLVIYKRLHAEILPPDKKIYYCIEQWPSEQDRTIYDIFLLIIIYVIPGYIVVTLYGLIGCSLCKRNHDLQRANSAISNDARILGGRRKLARMMVIVSILFAFSWMPYFILTVCSHFIKDKGNQELMHSIYPFALLLGHSNSAQSPLIYCFLHRGFKEFMTKLLRCNFSLIKQRRISFSSSMKRQRSTVEDREPRNPEEKYLMATNKTKGSAI